MGNRKAISLLIKIIVVLDIVAIIGVVLMLKFYKTNDDKKTENVAYLTSTITVEPTATIAPTNTPTPEPTKTPEKDPAEVWADEQIKELSLDTKLLQLFIITPEELTQVNPVTIAGNTTYECFKTYTVGGIIFFSQNVESKEQFSGMCSNYQKFSDEFIKLPTFLAAGENAGDLEMLKEAGINFDVKNVSGIVLDTSANDADNASLAAVKAINEGADMLLLTKNFRTVLNSVKEAVSNGTITEDRIDECVVNILKLKYSLQ